MENPERFLSVGDNQIETSKRVSALRESGNEQALDELLADMTDEEIAEMMVSLGGDVDQKDRFMRAVKIKLVKEGREKVPDLETYFGLFTKKIIKDKAAVKEILEENKKAGLYPIGLEPRGDKAAKEILEENKKADTPPTGLELVYAHEDSEVDDSEDQETSNAEILLEFKKGLTCKDFSIEPQKDENGLEKNPIEYEYSMFFVNSDGGVSETVIVPSRVEELMNAIPKELIDGVNGFVVQFKDDPGMIREGGVQRRFFKDSLGKLSLAIQETLKNLLSRDVPVEKRGSFNKFIFAPKSTADENEIHDRKKRAQIDNRYWAGVYLGNLVGRAQHLDSMRDEKDRNVVDDHNFDL
jgi:hypothetical protein